MVIQPKNQTRIIEITGEDPYKGECKNENAKLDRKLALVFLLDKEKW